MLHSYKDAYIIHIVHYYIYPPVLETRGYAGRPRCAWLSSDPDVPTWTPASPRDLGAVKSSDLIILYRTTKTASVRINLGVITFSSIPKRTPATCSIRHRASCLARYESLTSPDLHYDMAATLSLPPLVPPTQD